MVTLFGASGAIGHALAAKLDADGIPYRVVGRNVATLQHEFPNAPAVSADFLSGEGLTAAAAGATTVFYLAGAPYTDFAKHPIMVRNALEAVRAAGGRRFVHVAPVYSYGHAAGSTVAENQPHAPQTRKGRYRLEQEEAVLAAGDATLRTMVVHLPDFYGPFAELSYADVFMREAVAGKTASWIGPPGATREFLYVPDSALPLLRLSDDDGAYGRCWNLGGKSIVARDFIALVFEVLATAPRYRSIPKFALQGIGLFNPLMREIAEMYYLFASGFVLDDSALRSRIGEWPKTPFRDGVRQTIAWMRAGTATETGPEG